MKRFVVGFFGDGLWALYALEGLVADPGIKVAFVCTRFGNLDTGLEQMAHRFGIMHIVHPDVNSSEFKARLPPDDYDLFISMSFDQIFSTELIEYPRLRTINCHAVKLPFYRGRNVLNWVLINDEKEFGVTVHCMDTGIDTGDILAQQVYPITDKDDYATVLSRAQIACPELLLDTVNELREGVAVFQKQTDIHPLGSYCHRREPGDERLDWDQTSREVFNFVRAICPPGPAARTRLGALELRICRVEESMEFTGIPGTVIAVDNAGFVVATADSGVRVVDWSGVSDVRPGDQLT